MKVALFWLFNCESKHIGIAETNMQTQFADVQFIGISEKAEFLKII